MTNTECIICDEPCDALDDEGICPECAGENEEITAYELARAGIVITPDTDPLTIELAITHMTLDD